MSRGSLIGACAMAAATSAAVVATTDATADWHHRLHPTRLIALLRPEPNLGRSDAVLPIKLRPAHRTTTPRHGTGIDHVDVRLAATPAAGQMLYLIRSHLLALDHANKTENYTVLRALAAPAFQQRNTPHHLARSFANIRRLRVSLAPASGVQPLLVDGPRRTPTGLLRLAGSIPTPHRAIDFDMHFQAVGGHWRLFGLQIGARQTSPIRAAQMRAKSRAAFATPRATPSR